MATPGYPNARPIAVVAERLREAIAHPSHQFWPDDVSLLANDHLDLSRIHGPRQLTDAYLLSLALRHDGYLVTFDQAVPIAAVRGATPAQLLVL
jgi:predicted nucleic acid-binding protein